MEAANEPGTRRKSPRAGRLLAIDAWIDSALYEASFKASEIWENLTIFFRRFRVSGWRRGVFEILSEGFTLGTVGAILLLALAIPAFDETTGDWKSQGDFAVTFTDRYGNEIGQRGIIQRDSVPIDDMPDHVIQAVLATEDRRFFSHFGIDFLGLFRAMQENMRANSVVQGGSTITQQLAKNLFLTNERTVERKVKEAFLSLWLEMNLSKKEILQLYLDRAYMGGGTFGITAAADFYFGKGVKDLSLPEAAMLAGLFKAPAKYAPHINLPAARARANEVLTNMVQGGYATEGQVLSARLHPASVVDRGDVKSPDYFLDFAFEEAKRMAQKSGIHSMVARTTIDMNIQQAAEEAMEFHLRQFGKQYRVTEGAMVVLDNNGAVRAVVGGRDYGTSQFNRATRALRQAGSSFKPYVYAAAMEHGLTPETAISDGPISWGSWSPKNYGRSFSGRTTLTTALVKSINTVPVRLAKDYLTTAPIKALTEAMGVESPISPHKTMVLGTSGMTVMDQATGYSVFANGGLAGTRHAINQLVSHQGEVVFDYERDAEKPHRVLTEKSAAEMNSMLVQVPEWGTARRAALPYIRSAGKTGTTQSYRDAWYVGFTGNYTAAVWMGNDDFSPTNNMTGGSLPAMTWQRLMTYAHQNVELKPIPGLEQPFVDPALIAKAQAEAAKNPVEASAPVFERPALLSAATSRVLKEISETFRNAQPITFPPRPEALSALEQPPLR
ncbi:PBP1A family penicillin-binding protein [Mesorhizobium sp. NBSH29]|uniref:transglycosylase domain-containing protein n=1 Tax=Mesorhizobium sp. NBSH29 TaxID=2654249 RepID=UPI0018965046|nr:PBP1A family penicillin-binding protein [Mesorhizobium sp. NBSH29]QPC87201.1 PBP1A family penicillin-binding protein [Mesorhizobium sp. NBSH29]